MVPGTSESCNSASATMPDTISSSIWTSVDTSTLVFSACNRTFRDFLKTFETLQDRYSERSLETISKHLDRLWNEVSVEVDKIRIARAAF